jgi:uncharacterized membrane protein
MIALLTGVLFLLVSIAYFSLYFFATQLVTLWTLFLAFWFVLALVVGVHTVCVRKTIAHNQMILEDALKQYAQNEQQLAQARVWKQDVQEDIRAITHTLLLFEANHARTYIGTKSTDSEVCAMTRAMNMNLQRMSNALAVVRMLTKEQRKP